jgi:hypothetical protein
VAHIGEEARLRLDRRPGRDVGLAELAVAPLELGAEAPEAGHVEGERDEEAEDRDRQHRGGEPDELAALLDLGQRLGHVALGVDDDVVVVLEAAARAHDLGIVEIAREGGIGRFEALGRRDCAALAHLAAGARDAHDGRPALAAHGAAALNADLHAVEHVEQEIRIDREHEHAGEHARAVVDPARQLDRTAVRRPADHDLADMQAARIHVAVRVERFAVGDVDANGRRPDTALADDAVLVEQRELRRDRADRRNLLEPKGDVEARGIALVIGGRVDQHLIDHPQARAHGQRRGVGRRAHARGKLVDVGFAFAPIGVPRGRPHADQRHEEDERENHAHTPAADRR